MDSSSSGFSCYRCGSPYPISDRIGRRDACPKCDADLHCCLNCRFYSPGSHNQCSEPQADWVKEKDRANFCDYFSPGQGMAGPGAASGRSQDARSSFEELFKKKG